MNDQKNSAQSREISFGTLLTVLKSCIVWMLIACVVCGAVAGILTSNLSELKYKGTSEFWVINASSDHEYTTDAMLTAAIKIADDSVLFATGNVFAKEVVREGNFAEEFGCTEEEAVVIIMSMISAAKNTDSSMVFSVTVTSADKALTYRICKVIEEVMPASIAQATTTSEDALNAAKVSLINEVKPIDVYTVYPSTMRNAVLCAFIAAVIVYAIFFIIHLTDKKVYDEQTLKDSFSYPIIATIPEWITESQQGKSKSLRRKDVAKSRRNYEGKVLTESSPFAISEAFKTFRTNLCYSTASSDSAVFAVSSDFSGAGKSFTAANVAISFAMLGKRTLLVEGDMRCPDLARVFGGKSECGLSELLSGNADDTDSVVVKRDDGLSVLFSGHVPPNPSELLGSSRMSELVALWRENYDIVIIDMPPVIEVSDAGVIAPLVDGYIIVARSEFSDVSALADSIDSLTSVGGNIIGFALNDVNMKTGAYSKAYSYTKYARYGKYSKYRRYARYARYSAYSEAYNASASDENNQQ